MTSVRRQVTLASWVRGDKVQPAVARPAVERLDPQSRDAGILAAPITPPAGAACAASIGFFSRTSSE